MKKTAFTLIELLVVIVIIGILATIGIGTFNGYVEKARQTRIFAYAADVSHELKRQATLNETSVAMSYSFDNTLEDSSGNGLDINYADDPTEYEFIESDNTFLGSHYLHMLKGINSDPYKPDVPAPNEVSMSYLIRLKGDGAYAQIQLDAKQGEWVALRDYYHTTSQNLNLISGRETIQTIPNAFTYDTWQHVLHTYKDGVTKVYINGELALDYTTSTDPVLEFSALNRIHVSASYDLDFDIDNLEIYPFAVDVSNLQAPK